MLLQVQFTFVFEKILEVEVNYVEYGIVCHVAFCVTMVTFWMTLLINKLNEYCHGWWMS